MITKEFTIPKYVELGEDTTDRYSQITVEPFERGYGTTVGNSLRRALLASLEGSAVTAIRIEGVSHEFSAIPGVQEDVTDVVLNLKKCQIRLHQEESLIFSYKCGGLGVVTVGDLFKEQNVDVFNPDQTIFTCTNKSTKLEMEIKVARGRGYVTSEEFEFEHAPLGTIYLDANFSPVTKVNFHVEDARVGQSIDYDRLLLEIWTNGSISPKKALEEAAGLLIEHFRIFVEQESEGESSAGGGLDDPEMMRTFARPVEELELSVRAANCLKAANIHTIGELVVRDEESMLQFHNFGKKSLDEIKAILDTLGLSFGMNSGSAAAPAVEDAKEAVEAAVAEDEDEDGEYEEEDE